MRRFAILLTLFPLTTCIVKRAPPPPIPVSTYSFDPAPIYDQWLAEVQFCAIATARTDASFHIVHVLDSVGSIKWFVVPTERQDGAFLWHDGGAYNGIRTGLVGVADTIFLSGQRMLDRRVVKHELLHIIVDSPTERINGMHGRPWGFCEFI